MKEEICKKCNRRNHVCYDICKESAINQGYDLNTFKDHSFWCEPCPECNSCWN